MCVQFGGVGGLPPRIHLEIQTESGFAFSSMWYPELPGHHSPSQPEEERARGECMVEF